MSLRNRSLPDSGKRGKPLVVKRLLSMQMYESHAEGARFQWCPDHDIGGERARGGMYSNAVVPL